MREIKFRSWNTVVGMLDYFTLEDALTSDNSRISRKMISDDFTFEQFTGLTNKNGVEIYEGDVLTNEDFFDESCDMIVEMNDRGCFIARDKSNTNDFLYLDDLDFIVIGNIHQNPELLTCKQK